MPVYTRLQVRRGSGELWTSINPTLYAGEIGYETNTGKFKVGNGQINWQTLDYASVPLNSGNFISYSGVSGSGINIDFADDQSSATWYIDTDWLANFIANSSGSLNVEGVQDIIGNSGILGGFGINKDYDDGTGFTTVSVTGMALRVDESTGIGVSTSTENNNNVYTVSVTGIAHTLVNDWTEAVQDTVGSGAGAGFLVNNTGVGWNYNDGANELSVAVTGIPHTLITDWDTAISGSVPDNVDTLLVEGTGIGFIYNSGLNSLTIGVTGTLEDLSANLTADASELNVLDGVTPGTVSAGDAVVVDASKNIGDFNFVTAVTFSGDLVGDVTGNADTATEATNVTVTPNNGTNETVYLTFVDGSTGTQGIETDTDLSYNPSTNTLTVGTVVGNISSADQVKTVTTDTGTHYLTFVDSDNGSATNETVRTDGDLSYNAATNLLTAGNVTATGTVTADHVQTATLTTTGNVTVGGDLTVAGTTTTVNSTVVEIGDNIIRVNTSGLPTGGLEVRNSGTSDYKQLVWDNVDGRWEVGSENFQANRFISTVADGTAPFVVTSTTAVTNLNSDLLDGQDGSYYLDWDNFTDLPDPVITVALTGDVVGSDNLTWTNLNGNVSLSLNTTIQPNSVALGTDTTGQYASTINVTGTGLDITTANATDGTNYTIESNATPANTALTIVSRDASGDFSAGTISATFSGNGSSLTNLNATNISSGTLNEARLPSVSRTNGTAGPTNSFVSSVTTDTYGRVIAVNTTTHTLATTSVKGIASFDSGDFSVTTGAVSIKASGVGNLQLENDSVTFGTTEVELGSSSNRIDGLVAISGVSAAAPTVLTFCTIDGGTP